MQVLMGMEKHEQWLGMKRILFFFYFFRNNGHPWVLEFDTPHKLGGSSPQGLRAVA